MSKDNKWKKPDAPPPPMFFGKKERDLVKQINDEVIERVVGQQILYFPLDIEHTNYHPLYGEAIEKTFLPPVRVYALVEFQGIESTFMENVSLDKTTKVNVKFVRYGEIFYEIVKLNEPKLLFGQPEHLFEIQAECIRAREGVFDAG